MMTEGNSSSVRDSSSNFSKQRSEEQQSGDWTAIYKYSSNSLDEMDTLALLRVDRAAMEEHEILWTACFRYNMSFFSHLRKLEKEAIIIQYQLAYLSTLGGAYHLINKPLIALQIAKRQEEVGRRLGSTNLLIRAKVFQAVNLRILGDATGSESMFADCKRWLAENPWLQDVKKFADASEAWVLINYKEPSVLQIDNQTETTESQQKV